MLRPGDRFMLCLAFGLSVGGFIGRMTSPIKANQDDLEKLEIRVKALEDQQTKPVEKETK